MGMNSESANRAVAGVIGGHQFRVKSWQDAAALYNDLHLNGDIIRVRVL